MPSLSNLPIHPYGVVLALAFVAGIGLGLWNGRQLGYSTDRIFDLAVWFLLSAMVGARALYIVLYPSQFPTIGSWFAITQGGLVFFGGFLATAVTVIGYGRWHGLSLRDLGDLIAPCLMLGHAIGRVGCFLNGCCYGRPTDLPWGVVFPRLGDGLPRHPTQLYEAGFLLVLFFLAQWLFGRRVEQKWGFPGAIWGSYTLAYSGFRFAIEYLRGDDRGGFFTPAMLSISQGISLAGVVASLVWLHLCHRKHRLETATRKGASDEPTG